MSLYRPLILGSCPPPIGRRMATEQIVLSAPGTAPHTAEGESGFAESQELVTVVLPCLNEEDSVGMVVHEAIETLQNAGMPGEVVHLDNASSDASVEIAWEAR